MQLGRPQVPDEEPDTAPDREEPADRGPGRGGPPETDAARWQAAGEIAFTVPAGVIVVKFGLAALVCLLAVTAPDRSQVLVGVLAGVAMVGYAGRDLLARQRLRADRDGVVAVRGYAGRHRLSWAEIERVRVDSRARFGATTALLEIDAGAEVLLFSRHDLGVEPVDALAALVAVRGADG